MKFHKHYAFLLLCILVSQFLCSHQPQETTVTISQEEQIDFWSDYPNEVLAQEIIERMTNDELLAQIFMFGWAGGETPSLLTRWVGERELGSVKVFGWETQDETVVAKSISDLQRQSQENKYKIPLYVATDQEGGIIRHVKGATSETPGNLAIGSSGLPQDAWYSGYYIAQELRALGINMNFAPTVDIYSNLDSTVIASRSFGADPHHVGVLGASFSRGSMDAGVIPTAKHFPGHGDTGVDSHGILPEIFINQEQLETRELIPFYYLIEEEIPSIMSGHLSFPNIMENGEPASLSHFFITEILRKKMGYTGLIITDDMMMNGATNYTQSLSKAIVLAIQAGNDIIMSSSIPEWNDIAWTRSENLMKTDTNYYTSVKKAAYNVLLSKLNYFKGENPVPLFPDIEQIPNLVPNPESKAFFTSQAAKAITLFKKGDYPYTTEESANSRTLVVGQFQDFFNESVKHYENLNYHFFSYNLSPYQVQIEGQELLQLSQYYDTIIMCVANSTSKKVANYLKDCGKNVILISVLEPVHVFELDWADTILLAYSYSNYSFEAAFHALKGDFYPQGILPLETE